MGNIWGVMLGAFIIQFFDRILTIEISGWLQDLGQGIGNSYLANFQLSDWRYFLFGMTLVILMLVRPEGLFPSARRRAELRAGEDTVEGVDIEGRGVESAPEAMQARETLYDVRGDEG
jgi:branched-chain amino acid transport system permease protein